MAGQFLPFDLVEIGHPTATYSSDSIFSLALSGDSFESFSLASPSNFGNDLLDVVDLSCENNTLDETDHSLVKAVIEHCWWRASYEGTMLKQRADRIHVGAELVSVPFIHCLRYRFFMYLLFMTSAYNLCYCLAAINVLVVGTFPLVHINNVSVEGYRMKDGIHSALLVTSLRLQSACGDELSRQPSLSNLSDAFPGPVAAYGFTVNFNSSASCQDELAYFTLQESLGGGSRRTIGASSIRWVSGGLRLLTSGVNACAGTSTLSFAPPWPWHFADESALYLFLSACIPLTAAIFAAAGRPHDAQRAAAAAALTVAMSLFVAVAGFLGTGATSSAFYPAVLLLAHLIVAAPLAASHHRAPEAAMAAAALAMTGRALSDSLVFGDTAYLLARPPVAASMLALLAAALSIRVRAVRADAAAGAATAVAALDRAWAGFAAAAGNPGALEELGWLV